MMNYEKSKGEFLKIKTQIDDEIKKHGITQNLLNYEENLESSYQKVKDKYRNKQDKRYIDFNYFPCRACISLAKGYHYVALKEWLVGFKNFIEYTNQVKDASKWEESIDYYRSRLFLILQSRIEIFGNLPAQEFDKIIDTFKNTINAISTTNSLLIKIQETLIEAIDSIVANSTEIYTEEHLSREERIVDLLKKFENGNNYIIGMKSRIEFILLKREFHYYLREILKNKKLDELKLKLQEVIRQMKEAAGTEKNNFKKVSNGKDIDWKKFLSEIDGLTVEYYNTLWLHNDLIKAIKYLEQIFSKIRDNLNIISTSSMFKYFVNEFLFLQNYLKLLLVANDFKDFAQKNGVYEWQKKLSEDISNEIISIANKNFKYNIPQDIRRSLLIVEEYAAGKFLEFIIFYLLKELINHKSQALSKLNEIRNDDIRNFMELVLNSKSEEVRWSHRISDSDIDIDIFISGKYAIFLKTGIIGKSDRKSIQKELKVSKNYKVFYLLDVAKNLDEVKGINSMRDNQIILIDIGVFLDEIYKFAKKVGVQMELPKSSIKSLTGFHSGG